MDFKLQLLIFLLINYVNSACVASWGQCGGNNYNGESCCVSGYYCKYYNEWYSQCIPGQASSTPNTTIKTTTINKTTTAIKTTNAPAPAPTSSAGTVPGTIFIAGDSTADSTGANNGKTAGWGKFISDYVTCKVNNQAKSGQSARSFWRDGRWNTLINGVGRNDYVFIQFGHNDVGGPNNKSEKGSAGGEGDETVTVVRSNGQTEIVHTFPWYIRQMVKQVQNKGAKPVLLSYTPNFSFQDGKVPVGSRFQGYMKLVADEMKIPYIDLYSYIARQWEKLGEAYIKNRNWFPTDYKHTSPEGADFNAQMLVNGIKCQNVKDLVAALNNKGKNVNYTCSV